MKKLFLLLSLVGFSFMMNSCEEAEKLLNAKMTATIDGANWTAAVRHATVTDQLINIIGTGTNLDVVNLTVYGTTEGTYELTLGQANLKCAAVYKEEGMTDADRYVSLKGKIIIDDLNTSDKKISGTFEFSMIKFSDYEAGNIETWLTMDLLEIKSGSFKDLTYTMTSK